MLHHSVSDLFFQMHPFAIKRKKKNKIHFWAVCILAFFIASNLSCSELCSMVQKSGGNVFWNESSCIKESLGKGRWSYLIIMQAGSQRGGNVIPFVKRFILSLHVLLLPQGKTTQKWLCGRNFWSRVGPKRALAGVWYRIGNSQYEENVYCCFTLVI